MIKRLYRAVLKFCVIKLYETDNEREQFKIDINNDTYIGSYIDTGGHLLSSLSPITDYEIVSILNALKGAKSMSDGAVSSEKETYYKENGYEYE